MLDQPLAQVIRFQIPGTDPGFAEAFEDYFGRPYDEEEAEAVYGKVGEGPQLSPIATFTHFRCSGMMGVGDSNENCGPSWCAERLTKGCTMANY